MYLVLKLTVYLVLKLTVYLALKLTVYLALKMLHILVPTVTGSVFLQRFKFFLGDNVQHVHCKLLSSCTT